MSWRDRIPVHPAARKFELLTGRDRDDFDEDIFRRGVLEPVALWPSPEGKLFVLDGQNRLDAVERRIGEITLDSDGYLCVTPSETLLRRERDYREIGWVLDGSEIDLPCRHFLPGDNPEELVTSLNVHRRHLTSEQKRGAIEALLRGNPDRSDRAIGKLALASPTTVGKVRQELEQAGDVSNLDTRTDSKGRQQPAHKAEQRPARPDPAAQRGQPHRDGPDFWPTPPSLISALVGFVLPALPEGAIWECACGDRRMVDAIAESGRRAVASDLYPQDGSEPLDFLTADPPAPDTIAVTNPPFNQSKQFLQRGLALLDAGRIKGLVLLLRHDHLMASTRVPAFNRAALEVHCNWRPIWIENTEGNPRWSFHWLAWHGGPRQPPLYLSLSEVELTTGQGDELTPGESAQLDWLEQDLAGSYLAAAEEIGRRFRAGEPIPDYLRPKRDGDAV